MADLFTAAQKAQLSSGIDNIHDTFKIPIVVYKDPQTVVISSNPNYSRFQANNQNLTTNPENIPQVYNIYVRILYGEKQNIPYISPYGGGNFDQAELKLNESDGTVRIKVHRDDNSIFQGVKTCEFDGSIFSINSDVRPHRLFALNPYYTYYLKRAV